MAQAIVLPKVAGKTVFDEAGTGRFALSGVSGVRGTVELFLRTGTSGTARTFFALTDGADPSVATNYLTIGLDASNRPILTMTNAAGSVVMAVATALPPYADNYPLRVRFSWDSQQALDGTRRAVLVVNDMPVMPASWTTNPVANWTSFVPTAVFLYETVLSAQMSETTTTSSVTPALTSYYLTLSDAVAVTDDISRTLT